MTKKTITIRRIFVTMMVLGSPVSLFAGLSSWNSTSDGLWNVSGNWTPAGVPGNLHDASLGNISGTEGTRTTLAAASSAGSLTIIHGNYLDTASYNLRVNGLTSVSNAGTTLSLGQNNFGLNDSLVTDSLDIGDDASIRMSGGRLNIDGDSGDGRLDITGGGTLTGYGTLYFSNANPGAKFTMDSGNLSAGYLGSSLLGDSARTLHITAASTGATLDLDQGTSTVTVRAAGTLDINVPLNDPFGKTINLSRKSTLDIETPWSFDGTLDVATQAGALPGQTAGAATIAGARMTQLAGTITLDHAADHLIFTAPLTATGGTIDHDAGTIQFDIESTIDSGVDFQVGDATELIVNTRLTVNDADWNWDGNGGPDNIITINDNGRLVALLNAAGADDIWDGLMHINGGSLWVSGSDATWGSNGTILVGGTTESTIEGGTMTQSGSATTLRVADTAWLDMSAPNVWQNGTFVIDGRADLSDATTWAGTTVAGSGVLHQNADTAVTEDTTISVDTYDMDGSSGNSRFTVHNGKTFTINSARVESAGGGAFDGRISLPGGTLAVQPDWKFGDGALFTLSGGTLAEGGTLTMESGAIISVWDTSNVLDTDVVFEENSRVGFTNDGSELTLGDPATGGDTITLDGGDFFEDPGVSGTLINKCFLTVTGDSEINVDTFDWDSGATIVESTGSLNLVVTTIEALPNDTYEATLTIKGGDLNVNNAANLWIMDGTTRFYGGGTLSGDPVQIGNDIGWQNADLEVRDPGTARITAPVTFFSDAEVHIYSGATLRTKAAVFEPVNGGIQASFTGTGTWLLAGHNTFNEETMLNMVGGTVDLDNSVDGTLKITAYDTDINADLTILAETFSDYGSINYNGSSHSDMNIASAGSLTVILDDPAADWRVNGVGVVNYNGVASSSTFLAGADLRMDGTLNIYGTGRSTARMDIGGTVYIRDPAQIFRLGGGDNDHPNTLVGGTINGPGFLSTDVDTALSGYGTINAHIDFPGSAALYADNGTLTVTGSILDAYVVGTADTDGILNVVNDWDTTPSGISIRMNGGELRGGTVTLGGDGALSGYGLVSARVINNSRITAGTGETLILETALNDNLWDGILLVMNHSTLELRDNATYPFSSYIGVNQGSTVFLNGFSMTMGSLSRLSFGGGEGGGTLQYSGGPAMQIMGSVEVGAGAENAQLRTSSGSPGGFLFKAGCRVTLNGNLEINAQTSEIEKDVTFSGSGVLLNNPGSTLTLRDLARLSGTLQNRGSLIIGSSPGHVVGENFTQLADGTLFIEIAGTDIADRDTLRFSGHSHLAGTLDLSLLNGFTPSLGETYYFLETATISGTFNTVVQPPTMPEGLKLEVNYAPSKVFLTVVTAGDAYEEWIESFASLVDPADKLKTADPDGDGMNNLGEFALDGDPTNAATSGKIVGKIAPVGGADAMTLTFPVRSGSIPAASDPAGGELVLEQATEGVVYTVQGSADLAAFTLTVTEVTGVDAAAIQAGLPVPHAGWGYRSFRCPGPVSGTSHEFMRVRVSE